MPIITEVIYVQLQSQDTVAKTASLILKFREKLENGHEKLIHNKFLMQETLTNISRLRGKNKILAVDLMTV